MEISQRPPGLLSRRAFAIDQGRVVVEEEWNIDTPGCPMIRSPWRNALQSNDPLYVRQVVMTAEQFNHSNPPLFD